MTGASVGTLPGAWRGTVSAATGWPGVSIPGLGGRARVVCNFYLSVTTRTLSQQIHP